MKGRKLVSIIIPIYNSADFLDRTLKSVLGQTYKEIEVLLIDDGSTDESRTICERYKDLDSRIKVFYKENGGVSTARNVGLHYMKGEYCQFIDSDDMIPSNYTEILVERLEQTNCDVAFCGVKKMGKNIKYLLELGNEIFSREEYLYELYKGEKFATKSACIGLYKTDIIKNYKVIFPEEIRCGEDSIFIMKYIKYCRDIATVHDTVYYYMYDNNNSATSARYYDHFLIEMQRYELANGILKESTIKKEVAQFYMNDEIREILLYAAHSKEKYGERIRNLRRFVNNAGTRYAIKYYRRDDKKKSWFIPAMIKGKMALFLYLALIYRNKLSRDRNSSEVKTKSSYY